MPRSRLRRDGTIHRAASGQTEREPHIREKGLS